MTSPAPVMAALAAGLAVFAAWDLLAIVEAGGPARAVARILTPLRLAGRAGRVPTPPERRRLAVLGAGTLLAGGWLLAGPFAGVALALAAPISLGPLLAARRHRWRRALAAAVPQVARAMADALAGGRSIRSALADLGRPGAMTGAAGTELRAAAHRLSLGARTEDVLASLRLSACDPSWDTLIAAILLHRDAGGDLAALLRTVAESTENARRVESDARSLMSQARASARLVAGLPCVSLVLVELIAPGSLNGMAGDARSRLLLAAGLGLGALAMFHHQPHRAAGGGVSLAVLLAGLAGALSAVGLCDMAALVAERRATARRTAPSAPRRPVVVLARLGRRIGVPAAPRDLEARLAAAGLAGRLRPADAMAMKAGGGAAVVLASAPIIATLPPRLVLLALPSAAAGGFLALDLHLLRRGRSRTRQARVELADVLDLLRVATAAGLPTGRALAEVGRHRGGLVAAELRTLAERLALGVPRADALAELRRALPVPALATLVAAIDRADRHGASLAPALTALAEEARADRARGLRDQAARAAPRIQLAIALLLVPAVLLLVAGGLVHGLA